MMQINKQQLLRALIGIAKPSAKALDEFVASFNQWSQAYEINNTKRLVHYLAQVMHESACLRYTTEIASGAAYDTGAKAKALGNTPEKDGDGQKATLLQHVTQVNVLLLRLPKRQEHETARRIGFTAENT